MKIGSDVFTSEPSPKKTPKKRGAKATPEPKRRPKKGARTDEEVVADEGHPGSGAEDQADVDQPEHVGGEAHDAEPTASAEPAPPHDSTPDEQNTTERNTAESMDHATQEAADQNEVAAMVHPPVQPAAPPPGDSERDARKRLFGKPLPSLLSHHSQTSTTSRIPGLKRTSRIPPLHANRQPPPPPKPRYVAPKPKKAETASDDEDAEPEPEIDYENEGFL